jgi:hypothetical protein
MYFIETAERCSVEVDNPRRPAARIKQLRLLWLVAVPLACKIIFLALDSTPGFHLGDSGAYIATALMKWIPPDRSFTYGFLIRPLVLYSHSLTPVVLLQVGLSAVASALLGFLLLRYVRAPMWLALALSFFCAVEPLQLMEERYIMAETVATFLFALWVWASLAFLQTHNLSVLIYAQLLGIGLVSLRYSFIPLLILLSIALPILITFHRPARRKQFWMSLSVAVICSQLLLLGYRHLYGFLAHTEPSYSSRGGDFLVADMAPLLDSEDFPLTSERARLFQEVKIPLRDIDQRRFQRWNRDGLCSAILRIAGGNEHLANLVAEKTALRAMKRNPFGVLRLALQTYSEFLSYKKMRWALMLDQWGRMLDTGQYIPAEDNDVEMIQKWFGINARYPELHSVTKRWESLAAPWCWAIVLLPFGYAIEICIHWRRASTMDIFLLLSSMCMLASAVIPVEIANPRYLVPLPWLSILIIGVIWKRCRTHDLPRA